MKGSRSSSYSTTDPSTLLAPTHLRSSSTEVWSLENRYSSWFSLRCVSNRCLVYQHSFLLLSIPSPYNIVRKYIACSRFQQLLPPRTLLSPILYYPFQYCVPAVVSIYTNATHARVLSTEVPTYQIIRDAWRGRVVVRIALHQSMSQFCPFFFFFLCVPLSIRVPT